MNATTIRMLYPEGTTVQVWLNGSWVFAEYHAPAEKEQYHKLIYYPDELLLIAHENIILPAVCIRS
jgi:hypothetical protein